MLLLDARSAFIDGISVFPDHHDPEQRHDLPSAPHLTMVKDASGREVPSFLLLALIGEDNPGGLLSFDCNIGVNHARGNDWLAEKIGKLQGLANTPTRAGSARRRHGAADHPRHPDRSCGRRAAR